MTIETLAGPQPFFICLTNGTSSHIAAGAEIAKASANAASLPGMHDEQDDDRSRERNQDVSDLLIVERSGGEVVLDLAGPLRQPRQFRVAQERDSLANLGRIHAGRFHDLPDRLL